MCGGYILLLYREGVGYAETKGRIRNKNKSQGLKKQNENNIQQKLRSVFGGVEILVLLI